MVVPAVRSSVADSAVRPCASVLADPLVLAAVVPKGQPAEAAAADAQATSVQLRLVRSEDRDPLGWRFLRVGLEARLTYKRPRRPARLTFPRLEPKLQHRPRPSAFTRHILDGALLAE